MPGPTYATFGNTTLSRGFDFTFGPGVQPSVCLVYTIPHVASLPSVGTLSLITTGQQTLTFRECLLEEPRLDAGIGGRYWTLPIKDRRWKWQFAAIHGHYNVPRPDGTLLRERTPNALIGLLLQAMGETDWDTSQIPTTNRPEKHWDGASAAGELDALCNELGCVVVLNPLLDKVEIWPEGKGASLPTSEYAPTQGAAYVPLLPAKPRKIRTESGPTLFQALFKTEAVGLDVDNKWKPINSLSYKPARGWETASVGAEFPEITGTYVDLNNRTLYKRDLAISTVFKCYRITGLAQGGWVPPVLAGTGTEPTSLRDFKFYATIADEAVDASDGGLRQLDAVVYVKSFAAFEDVVKGNTSGRYTEGFAFDTTHAIVRFNEPQFQIDVGAAIVQAEVRIECSFNCGKDGVMARVFLEQDTGAAWTTPTRLIQRPDIVPRIVYRYRDDLTFTRSDNLADINAKLQVWQGAAMAEYGLQNGGTINYARLMAISPDGLTQQVSWSGGGNRPPRTVASQAQRHNRYIPTTDEYRARLEAKKAGIDIIKLTNPLGGPAINRTPFEAGT